MKVYRHIESCFSLWYNRFIISKIYRGNAVKLDGFGLFVEDIATMIRFYRDA